MATLNVFNYLSLDALGSDTNGKQGSVADAPQTPFAVTVTGTVYEQKGTLTTATVRTIWDEDANFPATFDYLFLWVDQIASLQLIAQSTNVIHRLAAKQPFVLPGYSTLLAAANTTIITGGTSPTFSQIDSVVLGNYSGSTLNYHLLIID